MFVAYERLIIGSPEIQPDSDSTRTYLVSVPLVAVFESSIRTVDPASKFAQAVVTITDPEFRRMMVELEETVRFPTTNI